MQEENYWTRALGKRFPRRRAFQTGGLIAFGLVGIAGTAISCLSQEGKSLATRTADSPKRGGTLRYDLGTDLPHWDIHTADNYWTIGPAQYVYSGLLKLDEKRTDGLYTEFTFYNDLAESYEQPQPEVFVFKLRRGVTFHDKPPVNGREMTSEDVKYSIDRIRTPEPQYVRRSMFEEVEKIETSDKYTVKFTLARPSVPFLYNVASPWTLIAAKEVVDKDGDLKKTLIGTGPFMLDKHTRNTSIKFKRNPDYFLRDKPYLDAIDVQIIPDTSRSLAALRSKELDVGAISYAESESFKKTNPDAEIVQVPGPGKMVCFMRLDRPPLNDVGVRQALMYATDYQEFIDVVFQGQGRRDGPLQWWLKPYALSEDELPTTDLDKARQLLAAAGYPNGFKIQATVSTTLYGAQLAEIAQSQWEKVGVEIEIKTLDWGAWLDTVWGKKDFSLYFLQDWNYEDPDRWLYPYFYSKGSQNFSGYSDPDVDDWLDKQRETFDVEERAQIFKDIQRKLLDDVAYIPLFTPILYFVRHPYVKGWEPYASWPGQHSFGALRGWLNK